MAFKEKATIWVMNNVDPKTIDKMLLKYIEIKGKIDNFKAKAKKNGPIIAGTAGAVIVPVVFVSLRNR